MSEIKIKPSKQGSLTAIAKKSNAMTKSGKIDPSWMAKKMKSSKTSPAVKKKINFALNARKWD